MDHKAMPLVLREAFFFRLEAGEYGAWDAMIAQHSPFTVLYHSDSVSHVNHRTMLNCVIGVRFPKIEPLAVERVVNQSRYTSFDSRVFE